MFKPTSKQRELFDAASQLDERRRKLLEKGWAGRFQQEVLPILLELEGEFAHLYGDTGRPTWSVARMTGLLLLRELVGLKSDQEAVDALAFDVRWQHALDAAAPKTAYLSRRSLTDFRSRLARQDPEGLLMRKVFDGISATAIRKLGISTKKQRTDSMFVEANIKRRNRAALLLETLRVFLEELVRRKQLAEVPAPVREWFEGLSGWESTTSKDIDRYGYWMRDLLVQFDEDEVASTDAYQTLERVFHEHFELRDDQTDDDDDEPPQTIAKDRKARNRAKAKRRKKKRGTKTARLRGDVVKRAQGLGGLQSPHDHDARKGYKGVGYHTHLTETCGNDGKPEILTDVDVVPANRPDGNVLPEIIERLLQLGLAPKTTFADGAYSSLANARALEAHGIALEAPIHRGHLHSGHPKMSRADFDFDGDTLRACPGGHAPTRLATLTSSAVDRPETHALFDGARCAACPHLALCPTQRHNRGKERKLCLAPELRQRDLRHEGQREPAWKEAYGIRAGVEASASEMARAHGAKRLSVRGLIAVRARTLIKAAACNVKRWLRAPEVAPGGQPARSGRREMAPRGHLGPWAAPIGLPLAA